MRRAVVCLAVVANLSCTPAPEVAQQAEAGDSFRFESLMNLGRSALQARHYFAARSALEKAVRLRPGDAGAHYYLAQAYAGDTKYRLASRHLKHVLSLSPGYVKALLDLATIEENAGRFEEAGFHYREVLKLGPDTRAQRGLASLLAKQNRLDDAIAMLRGLARVDETDIELRYQLGVALMQSGDCSAAVPEFRAVKTRKPDHIGALFNLGNCLNRVGTRDEARRILDLFREVSQAESQRALRQRRVHFLLRESIDRFESGNIEGVAERLEEAIRLNPENPSAYAIRAQILNAMGQPAEALEDYRKAAELDPSDTVMLMVVGRLLVKSGRFAEALPFLLDAARADPQMPEPHFLLAAVYRRLDRRAEASAEEAIYLQLAVEQPAHPPR